MDLIKAIAKEGKQWSKEGRHTVRGIRRGLRNMSIPRTIKPKIRRTRQFISDSVGSEVKRVDFYVTGPTALVAVGTVAHNQNFGTGMAFINGIQQGSGDNNRVGNKVDITSIICKFQLQYDTNPSVARCLLVYDAAPDSVAPDLVDILYDFSETAAATTFNMGNNIHNSKRFTILRNQTFELNANDPLKSIKWVVKKRMGVQFDGTNNPITIADITRGAVFFIAFYSGATAPKILNGAFRTKYDDK